jgi:DNA-binding transcriptional regulator YhcF (GntR family)
VSERAAPLADALCIAINRNAEVPIGVQIAWTLRARVGDGTLQPGQRLPGLRELAEAAGVNVNTARAVYQRLEHEGLIDSQQGSGTFVTSAPPRSSTLSHLAATAALEAYDSGIQPRHLAAALYVLPDSPKEAGKVDAERRRVLRAQITALELTAAELEAEHPVAVQAPRASRLTPGPRLLSTPELEQVRATLVRRLTQVQTAIDDSEGYGDPDETQQTDTPAATKPVKRHSPRPRPRAAPAGT